MPITAFAVALGLAIQHQPASPPAGTALIVRGEDVMVRQPPPHGAIGMSTAYRISDAAPNRALEFRVRILHPGAAIGLHPLIHDEVYYVVSGTGDVVTNGVTARLEAGDAAYMYDGEEVGVWQVGDEDLVLVIAYPLRERAD